MTMTALVLVSLMGASSVSSDAVRWFPGDYFDARVRSGFHSQVLASWPGPGQLVDLWHRDRLGETEKVSFLLGGAAFHDPVLLPVYREAVLDPSQRVRKAAVYGFRDLLADSLPNVQVDISDGDAALLAEEMDWVMATLNRRSVLELWLQALLAQEDLGFPNWRGVTFKRGPDVCVRAAEKLADFADLDLLLRAYDISQDFSTRVKLLKLIEGVTLSRFIVLPGDSKEGWGRQVFVTAMDALAGARRQWAAGGCSVDGSQVLEHNLERLGVVGVDALSEEGCLVWVNVLDRGYPRWWRMAMRRLYACGGPWVEFPVIAPEGSHNRERRTSLLQWFTPLRPDSERAGAKP